MEHVISAGCSLVSCVGIDISEGGIKGAVKRLSQLTMADRDQAGPGGAFRGGESASSSLLPLPGGPAGAARDSSPALPGSKGGPDKEVDAALYLGSALSPELCRPEAWGGLRGCSIATLVEVVEHLYPPLLE